MLNSRENFPDISFVDTDTERLVNSLIRGYEMFTGRTLFRGDPTRKFIEWIADIIIQAAAFSVVSYRTSALIGAFRFKAWQTQRETRYRIVINHPTKKIADTALDELIKAGFNTARQEQSSGKFKTIMYGDVTFTSKSRAEKGVDTVKARGYNAVIEEC
jgi:hypothetical protein